MIESFEKLSVALSIRTHQKATISQKLKLSGTFESTCQQSLCVEALVEEERVQTIGDLEQPLLHTANQQALRPTLGQHV